MKLKNFLVVTAALAAIFGIVFILLRDYAMGIAGAMGSGLISQVLGANFIGFAVLNFFARNLKDEQGLKVIVLANFTSNVLGFLLTLAFGLTSGLTLYGWIAAAIYLLLVLGFGYYLLFQTRQSLVQMPS